jgi:hypothetical protein
MTLHCTGVAVMSWPAIVSEFNQNRSMTAVFMSVTAIGERQANAAIFF